LNVAVSVVVDAWKPVPLIATSVPPTSGPWLGDNVKLGAATTYVIGAPDLPPTVTTTECDPTVLNGTMKETPLGTLPSASVFIGPDNAWPTPS
jgi:hypothetical protein